MPKSARTSFVSLLSLDQFFFLAAVGFALPLCRSALLTLPTCFCLSTALSRRSIDQPARRQPYSIPPAYAIRTYLRSTPKTIALHQIARPTTPLQFSPFSSSSSSAPFATVHQSYAFLRSRPSKRCLSSLVYNSPHAYRLTHRTQTPEISSKLAI